MRTGNVGITRALLEAGADTTAKDWYGKTALCAAVLQWPNGAELDCVLFEHGTDPDLASGFGPVSPLLEAVWYGRLETALLLYPIAQQPEFDDHDRIHLTRNDFGPLVAAVAVLYHRGEFPPTDESLVAFPDATRAILLVRLDDLRRLLIGYADNLNVFDREGRLLGPPVSNRYPWRLIKCVDWHWKALYYDREPDTDTFERSIFPRFGLNGRFLGGDSRFYAFDPNALARWGPSTPAGSRMCACLTT